MPTGPDLTFPIKLVSNQFIVESCYQSGMVTNNTLCIGICSLHYAKGIHSYGTHIKVYMLNDMYIVGNSVSVIVYI
jgi:hypothetical protein